MVILNYSLGIKIKPQWSRIPWDSILI